MTEEVKLLHDEFLDLKMRAHETLRQIKEKYKDMSEADQCDIGYFLREMENATDDFRKDCMAHKDLLGKALSIAVTERSLTDIGNDSVNGNYSRGVANLKIEAGLPKRGTHEYDALCNHFGIDPTLPFSPSWKRIGELVTECVESGAEMPPGLGKKYPKYTTTFYRRKK